MKDEKRQVFLPPLRPYEMPDTPATVMDIPPEKETFVVPGEQMTVDELRSLARPVAMPPLHPLEEPDSIISVFKPETDAGQEEAEWGAAKRAPEITTGKGKLLHPWDD
jgi:hypothetical protein